MNCAKWIWICRPNFCALFRQDIPKVGSSKMKSVDVRFVCATNRDPWKEVQEGRFREDLYYRLYVIPLHLPPLRARGDDVIEIAYSLLGFMSKEEGKRFCPFVG